MEIFLAPRQGGKTHHLLDWLEAAEEGTGRAIIFPTGRAALYAYRTACEEARQIESWQFLGWEAAMQPAVLSTVAARGGFTRFEFAVDGAETILSQMLRPAVRLGPVTRLTLNAEALRLQGDAAQPTQFQTAFFPANSGDPVEFKLYDYAGARR